MERKEKKHLQHRIDQFTSLTSLKEVANLLGVKPSSLAYMLYHAYENRDGLYKVVKLKKKTGGEREIHIPSDGLKKIQSRLNKYLQDIYWEKKSAHGFIQKRSIITNANNHKRKKYVLNIDLKDFFPSINFGRVYGLLMGQPYGLPKGAAKVIAQIACTDRFLPQGSPCSPIISNMICSYLDYCLERYAEKYSLRYTRYADDITFSTNLSSFPEAVCTIGEDRAIILGDGLISIIEKNGFQVNQEKIGLYDKQFRQEVTGIVVNRFINVPRSFVRNTRAMLDKWRRKGIEEAKREYDEKYKHVNAKGSSVSFHKALLGKINFIRDVRKNKANSGYIKKWSPSGQAPPDIAEKFYREFSYLYLRDLPDIAVQTEGKTDWMHIKTAFESVNADSNYQFSLNFFDIHNKYLPGGDKNLLGLAEKIKSGSLPDFDKLTILIFDRDNKEIIKRHTDNNKDMFVQWSENMYSIILPRECSKAEKFSIEFLYKRDEIGKRDKNKRKLFFSDEFEENGEYKKNKKLVLTKINKYKDIVKVVEDPVVYKNKNYTMSKSDFAKKIMRKNPPFNNISFKKFEPLFDLIAEIYAKYKSENSAQT
jgi:RNA-directed DNA polymerase